MSVFNDNRRPHYFRQSKEYSDISTVDANFWQFRPIKIIIEK
jgi:hypothetical protein